MTVELLYLLVIVAMLAGIWLVGQNSALQHTVYADTVYRPELVRAHLALLTGKHIEAFWTDDEYQHAECAISGRIGRMRVYYYLMR